MNRTEQEKTLQCFATFKSIRSARNFFGWLLLLCVIIQVSGFAVVFYGDVLKPLSAEHEIVVANHQRHLQAIEASESFRDVLDVIFPVTRFMALFCGVLLVITAFFGAMVALVFRSASVKWFVGAFFWMVIVLFMVIPWQKVFDSDFAAGALFDLSEIMGSMGGYSADGLLGPKGNLMQLKYIGYPLGVIIVWITGQIKFAKAGSIAQKELDEFRRNDVETIPDVQQQKLFPDISQ